jgi:hypothetical protein
MIPNNMNRTTTSSIPMRIISVKIVSPASIYRPEREAVLMDSFMGEAASERPVFLTQKNNLCVTIAKLDV